MFSEEYISWVEKNSFLEGWSSRPLFYKAARLGGEIKVKTEDVGHEIDTSINSRDRNNLLKISHIFHRFGTSGSKKHTSGNFIERRKLANFINGINEKLRLKFNTSILSRMSNLPQKSIMGENCLVINFDFTKEGIEKISMAFNPLDPKKADKFFNPILMEINREFINVDLFPDGKARWKIYESQPLFLSDELFKINYQKFEIPAEVFKRTMPAPDYILSKKEINSRRDSFKITGIYFGYEKNKFPAKKASSMNYPGQKCFLKYFSQLAKKFSVSFFSFKPDGIVEIYFK